MTNRSSHDTRQRILQLATMLGIHLAAVSLPAAEAPSGTGTMPYASPTAVTCSANGRWLATANRGDNSVSLIDRKTGQQVDRLIIGQSPQDIVAVKDNWFLCVTTAGDLVRLAVAERRLTLAEQLPIGGELRGIAVSAALGQAWITRSLRAEVAVVDLEKFQLVATVSVGGLPRGLAMSPDGRKVAVTCSGPGEILLCDTATGKVIQRHGIPGLNVGTPAFAPKGDAVFFPWTYDAGSHPSRGNIRRGWVVGSRVGRLTTADGNKAGEQSEVTGMTLDVPGRAVGDVAAIAVTDDRIFLTAGGSHEILRLSCAGLPLAAISGTDLIEPTLAADSARFQRLILGGRPQGLCLLPADRRGYITDQLADAVHEIDLDRFILLRTMSVASGTKATPQQSLARQGEAIFYDAERSLDQWYSCHTCHFEGGGNSVTLDTFNDGSVGSYKTVLPLFGVTETGPWTWHGWQTDLRESLAKSFTDTMQGKRPTAREIDALLAYLETLRCPPSPFQATTPQQAAAITRGQKLFMSKRAGCITCHDGPGFSGGGIHEVDLGSADDAYVGFNPPALVGLSRKTNWLHHGRARTLEDLLIRYHGPDRVSGNRPFAESEVQDLVAFLRSL